MLNDLFDADASNTAHPPCQVLAAQELDVCNHSMAVNEFRAACGIKINEFEATVPEYLETTPIPRKTEPETEKLDASDGMGGMIEKLNETWMWLKE